MLEHLLEHPLTVRRFVQQWDTVNMYLNHEIFIDFEVFLVGITDIPNYKWLVVSTPLKNISQLG